jgi:hypothetical protein
MTADRPEKEPAEGSRQTVDEAVQKAEDSSRQGVSNKPRNAEQEEQAKLPRRGDHKVE